MKVVNTISNAERTLLILFAFFVSAFYVLGISAEAIQSFNDAAAEHQKELARQAGALKISFSVCGFYEYPVALFHLITLPIFVALIGSRKFIVSTILTICYAVLIVISVMLRLDGVGALGGEGFFTDHPWYELWMKTSINDYLAAGAVVILLFWQATILLRFLIRSLRRLP